MHRCYGNVVATVCGLYASHNYLPSKINDVNQQKFHRYICLKEFKIRKKSKDQIFYNQLIKRVESDGRISGAQSRADFHFFFTGGVE